MHLIEALKSERISLLCPGYRFFLRQDRFASQILPDFFAFRELLPFACF
jgi:hypothetical protein